MQTQLIPHLGPQETLRFDVTLDWTNIMRVADRADTQHAKIELVASVDVSTLADGTMEVTQRFETPTVTGDGDLGLALQRAGSAITDAAVTTRIARDGMVASSRIDGAADDEVRALVGGLGQLISFRFARAEPVAVGAEWEKSWTDTATGAFETTARYRLDAVTPCGASSCGVIDVQGRDTDGRSAFDGQLVVELDSLRPVRKHVASTTTATGERDGSHYTLETKTVITANRR